LLACALEFGYGDVDFSGDPDKDNGLDLAWIAFSLKISPCEQTAFLASLVNRSLPEGPQEGGAKNASRRRLERAWQV